MSEPFVLQLRAGARTLDLVREGDERIVIRVEMPETWQTLRVAVSPGESALVVKQAALDVLFPAAEYHEDFVLKLAGWEILDEALPLSELDVINGSILLLTHRRRRAVR